MTSSSPNRPEVAPAYLALAPPVPPEVLSDFRWACDFIQRVGHPNNHAKVHALVQVCVNSAEQEQPIPLLDLPWQVVSGYFPVPNHYHSWLMLPINAGPADGSPYLLDLCPLGGASGPVLYRTLPPCWGPFDEVPDALDQLVTAQHIADCLLEYQGMSRKLPLT